MKTTKTLIALAACLGLAFGSIASARDIYYVNDHLATTLAVIDDVEGEIAQLEADAFGSPISHGGNFGTPARYTGKPYDEDLGAYVFPFRNYRSEEGRWMSTDPSGFPDGVNNFLYAGNDILSSIDPYGLASMTVTGNANETIKTYWVETDPPQERIVTLNPSINVLLIIQPTARHRRLMVLNGFSLEQGIGLSLTHILIIHTNFQHPALLLQREEVY